MATQEEYNWLISRLKERVQNGDATAMKNLGDAYFAGPSGKEKNHSAAFPYWKAAVDHGDLSIAGKVGAYMVNGIGCAKDEKGAIPYLIKGADNGDVMAQYQLGVCYEGGIGCEENSQLAIKYYRMAALQNMPDTLDMTGGIIEHYKAGHTLPNGLEKARSIAMRGGYDFIEVYVDCCRAISSNGSVSVISC